MSSSRNKNGGNRSWSFPRHIAVQLLRLIVVPGEQQRILFLACDKRANLFARVGEGFGTA